MKNIRKVSFVVLLLVFTLFLNSYAKAANSVEAESMVYAMQPHWENTSSVTAGLSFSGTTANCSAIVVGLSGTTRIVATIRLERLEDGILRPVRTWSNQSANASTLTFSNTHTVTRGFTYRLTVEADVTRNGVTERATSWVERTLS